MITVFLVWKELTNTILKLELQVFSNSTTLYAEMGLGQPEQQCTSTVHNTCVAGCTPLYIQLPGARPF